MTREGARLKLRELVEGILSTADRELGDAPDVLDAVRLLAVREGRSEQLLLALVEEAGFTPLTPLGDVFLDEEPE